MAAFSILIFHGIGGSVMVILPEVSAETDEKFMREALRQAKKAYALREVPIGCVIVYEGKIIARGYNRRNTDQNTTSHAEINAIRRASKKLGDWRLEGCTIYITLEPCQMCAGAIVQSRITRAVIGSMNPKAGCAGSILNLLEMPEFNHQVKVSLEGLTIRENPLLKEVVKYFKGCKRMLLVSGLVKKPLNEKQPTFHDVWFGFHNYNPSFCERHHWGHENTRWPFVFICFLL